MGFKLPSALAGDDNEVEMNEEGARRVVQLIGGTAVGAMILALGAYLANRALNVAGSQKNVNDFY